MFEQSLVDLKPKRRRTRWTVLPLAALAHLVLLSAVVSAAYWQVGEPGEPRFNAVFLVGAPPPPPPAAGTHEAVVQETKARTVEPEVHATVQPPVVPDTLPTPVARQEVIADTAGEPDGETGGQKGGKKGGVPFSPFTDSDGPGPFPGPTTTVVPVEPSKPIQFGAGMTKPEVVFRVEPRYTELARKARLEGVVIVEAIIDEQGNVDDVRIIRPLPMGLDQSAVQAVSQWRFRPALLAGHPVKVFYRLTVNFQVH
jgi:periplasmic protein TonB